MRLSEIEIIQLIEKLQKGEGTDSQQEEWVNEIFQSVPFANQIYQLLFWSDEIYTSDEGELFLNQLAVYGTSLAKGSIQQQLSELERTIKNFSDINYRDRNGMTFLSIAVQQQKLDVIKILLENGANPNIEDNSGIPPLSYVFLRQTPNTDDIIKLLLNYGADPISGKTLKQSPFYFAKVTQAPQHQIKLLNDAVAKIHGTSLINSDRLIP